MEPRADADALRASRALVVMAERVVHALGWQDDATVLGAFLVGSTTRGDADAFSDVDVVAVCDPIPDDQSRLRTYVDAGFLDVMLDFLSIDGPGVVSNIAAVDKATFEQRAVDLCYCTPEQSRVFDFQAVAVLMSRPRTRMPLPEIRATSIAPDRVSKRVTAALRVIEVHRLRYVRDCARQRWLEIDLSTLLREVRDVLMVLDGTWRYNEHGVTTWRRVQAAYRDEPKLLTAAEDIARLDDRVASTAKVARIDDVLGQLKMLCAARGVEIGPYFADSWSRQ